MIFSLRGWICAGGLSLLLHASMAWSFTPPQTVHHVAKARGQQVSVAGALSQYMSTPQTLKVEPEEIEVQPEETASIEPVNEKTFVKPVKQKRHNFTEVERVDIQPLKIDRAVDGIEKPVEIEPVPTKMARLTINLNSVQTISKPAETTRIKPAEITPAPAKTVKLKIKSKPVLVRKPALLAPVKAAKVKPVIPRKKAILTTPVPVKLKKTKLKIKPRKKATRKKKLKKKKKGSNKNQRVASLAGIRGSKLRKNNSAARAGDRGNSKRVSGRAAISDYIGQVLLRIRRHQRYPRRARARNLKGTTFLRFTILRNGQVRGVKLSRSSGHQILDNAALATISRAAPFPSFPAALRRKSLRLKSPLRFTLRR